MYIRIFSLYGIINFMNHSNYLNEFIDQRACVNMRFEQLQYFIETANLHSMSLAAKKLYVSQQSISKSIIELEQECSTQLFHRSKHGLFLTPEGEQIYITACEIVKLTQKLQNRLPAAVNQEDVSYAGDIYLACSHTISPLILNWVQNVYHLHNQIHFIIEEKDPSELIALSTTNSGYQKYDLIFSNMDQNSLNHCIKNWDKNYSIFSLAQARVCLFMKKNDPLAQQKYITLNRLSQLPLACYMTENDGVPFTLSLLKEKGIEPNVIFSTNSFPLCIRYLLNGSTYCLGDNLTFPLYLNQEIDQMIGIPIQPSINWHYVMIVAKEHIATPQTLFFKNYIMNNFSDTLEQIYG